jgi:hypothetical protein
MYILTLKITTPAEVGGGLSRACVVVSTHCHSWDSFGGVRGVGSRSQTRTINNMLVKKKTTRKAMQKEEHTLLLLCGCTYLRIITPTKVGVVCLGSLWPCVMCSCSQVTSGGCSLAHWAWGSHFAGGSGNILDRIINNLLVKN